MLNYDQQVRKCKDCNSPHLDDVEDPDPGHDRSTLDEGEWLGVVTIGDALLDAENFNECQSNDKYFY